MKAAFASNFIEGQTQTYRFEDTTEEAIHLMVNWVYTQQLDIPDPDDGVAYSRDLEKSLFKRLCELWVLADKILIPQLQNAAMDALIELSQLQGTIPTHNVRYIWNNTQRGSPIRAWFLNKYAFSLRASSFTFEKLAANCPPEMIIELAVLLVDSNDAETTIKHRDAAKKRSYHVDVPEL